MRTRRARRFGSLFITVAAVVLAAGVAEPAGAGRALTDDLSDAAAATTRHKPDHDHDHGKGRPDRGKSPPQEQDEPPADEPSPGSESPDQQEPGGEEPSNQTWAPADSATIHPGVQTVTEGAQCTSNFVFTDGSEVYLGQAAHCAGTGGATETNGCDSGSLPLGTPVEIEGASQPGTLVYSSWLTMQKVGEGDENACEFNDFALVRIDPADVASVNPSIPSWGGPAGQAEGAAEGEDVYSYGNSGLRAGLLSPKQGTIIAVNGEGWSYDVYTVTPGIPGDSGSAFLNFEGKALGVLVTVQLAPLAGSNGITDLTHALDYLQTHTNIGARSVDGTEPFDASSGALLDGLSPANENADVGVSVEVQTPLVSLRRRF